MRKLLLGRAFIQYALPLLIIISSCTHLNALHDIETDTSYCFEHYGKVMKQNSDLLDNDYDAYNHFLDSLIIVASNKDCKSGVYYLNIAQLIYQFGHGHGNTCLLENIDDMLASIDDDDPEYYDITSSLLSIQCAFYSSDNGLYSFNKCEDLFQYTKRKPLKTSFKTAAYTNLLTSYPKTEPSIEKFEKLIEDAIDHIKKYDPLKEEKVYSKIANYYATQDKEYPKAIIYFNKAKKSDKNDNKQIKQEISLFEYYFHLDLYNQIIDDHNLLNQNQTLSIPLFKIKAMTAYAYLKTGSTNKARQLLNEALTIKDKLQLKKQVHDITIVLTQAGLLEEKQDPEEAYMILLDYYNSKDARFFKKQIPKLTDLLLHHIMRLEEQIGAPLVYNTIKNHEQVFESIVKGLEYPFNDKDILIYELDYPRSHYTKTNQDSLARNHEKIFLELLTKKYDDEERVALFNSKIREYQEQKSSLESKIEESRDSLHTRSKILIILSVILAFLILLSIFFIRKSKKIDEEKKNLTLMNEWVIERAKNYKNLQMQQVSYFQHMAHDIRGPLSRLENLQKALLTEKDANKIAENRKQSNLLGNEIKESIKELNEFLFQKNVNGKDEFISINLNKMIQKVEMQIDESIVKPYNIKINGSQNVIAPPKSLLILLKNCLENSFKHCTSTPIQITIDSQSKGTQIQLSFMDNGNQEKPNMAKSTKVPSYGLGLQICEAIVTKHGGSLQIDNSYKKGFKVDMLMSMD